MSSGLLRYGEMLTLVREIDAVLVGSVLCDVQEVGEKSWVFCFEKGEKRLRLLLSTQFPVARFHLAVKRYAAVSSPFADRLRELLRGKRVEGVALLNGDRIFSLSLGGMQIVAAFVSRVPQFVVLDRGRVVFSVPICSQFCLPEKKVVHAEVPLPCSSAEIEEKGSALQEAFEREALRKELRDRLKERLRKVERRLALHREERKEAEGYPEEEYVAQLLQANYPRLQRGLKEIEVEDWKREGEKRKIPLEPDLLPKEQIEKAFKRVRKLKSRLHSSLRWMQELEAERQVLEELKREIEGCSEKQALEKIREENPFFAPQPIVTEKEKETRRAFRVFKTEAGLTILVGKTDRDNDRLTFSVARGNDLWFHAANFPGSHVVLQKERKQEVDDASLRDAMLLALHFSKAKTQEAEEVIFTECKHVSKPKGAPFGKVLVSVHKKRLVRQDKQRLGVLLS